MQPPSSVQCRLQASQSRRDFLLLFAGGVLVVGAVALRLIVIIFDDVPLLHVTAAHNNPNPTAQEKHTRDSIERFIGTGRRAQGHRYCFN